MKSLRVLTRLIIRRIGEKRTEQGMANDQIRRRISHLNLALANFVVPQSVYEGESA